ncbi:hypothetical protein LWI29_024083 [Acer saccharum]|uniref:Uncharacterized protein n=1 Tax=Acer saccharum TaxID=4024 RepID=A0AA39VEK6_ACESA|nr:hypothetical protein LWI29_024083 [Acer saccharum]
MSKFLHNFKKKQKVQPSKECGLVRPRKDGQQDIDQTKPKLKPKPELKLSSVFFAVFWFLSWFRVVTTVAIRLWIKKQHAVVAESFC